MRGWIRNNNKRETSHYFRIRVCRRKTPMLVETPETMPLKTIWGVKIHKSRGRGRRREDLDTTVTGLILNRKTTMPKASGLGEDKKQWAKFMIVR